MRLSAGQVRVIMALMHDHHRRRAINHGPFFLARFVDHPIVPTGATDGKVWDFLIAGFREEEKIASRGTMKLSLRSDSFFQPILPAFGEFDGLSDIQVPTPTQQNKFFF